MFLHRSGNPTCPNALNYFRTALNYFHTPHCRGLWAREEEWEVEDQDEEVREKEGETTVVARLAWRRAMTRDPLMLLLLYFLVKCRQPSLSQILPLSGSPSPPLSLPLSMSFSLMRHARQFTCAFMLLPFWSKFSGYRGCYSHIFRPLLIQFG